MHKIYAKPGTSEQLFAREGEYSGFVRMEEERPAADYVCRSNYNGTGDWVRRSPSEYQELAKDVDAMFGKINMMMLQAKTVMRNTWWLWVARSGYPLFRSSSLLLNLVVPDDSRKAMSYAMLVVSILLVNQVAPESLISSALISIIAACIFDLIIILLPREARKRAAALKLSRAVKELAELKNRQYINICYLKNPLALDASRDHSDEGLNAEKFQRLSEDLVSRARAPVDPLGSMELIGASLLTNEEFCIWARNKLLRKLQEMRGDIDLELFPLLGKFVELSIWEIEESLNYPVGPISHLSLSEKYVRTHFAVIERLEHIFRIECFRYVGFNAGFYHYWLKVGHESIRYLF